jgi:hypothetical protein
MMYGKGVLTEKKRSGPKGRGQRMGVLSVTEGMVACTAIFVSLLDYILVLCFLTSSYFV